MIIPAINVANWNRKKVHCFLLNFWTVNPLTAADTFGFLGCTVALGGLDLTARVAAKRRLKRPSWGKLSQAKVKSYDCGNCLPSGKQT
jgi:hypothetical protein